MERATIGPPAPPVRRCLEGSNRVRSEAKLLGLGRCRRRCCRRRYNGIGVGIDPAGMGPRTERIRRLGIDGSLPHDAAKGGLDVPGRTAETIVKVEMAKGCIEIVAPQ